ncbi:MAG: hypothetical protein N2444_04190, partial [Methylocystis sp.]|nr:hypothetical protein [Methylocystis sp.]
MPQWLESGRAQPADRHLKQTCVLEAASGQGHAAFSHALGHGDDGAGETVVKGLRHRSDRRAATQVRKRRIKG